MTTQDERVSVNTVTVPVLEKAQDGLVLALVDAPLKVLVHPAEGAQTTHGGGAEAGFDGGGKVSQSGGMGARRGVHDGCSAYNASAARTAGHGAEKRGMVEIAGNASNLTQETPAWRTRR